MTGRLTGSKIGSVLYTGLVVWAFFYVPSILLGLGFLVLGAIFGVISTTKPMRALIGKNFNVVDLLIKAVLIVGLVFLSVSLSPYVAYYVIFIFSWFGADEIKFVVKSYLKKKNAVSEEEAF